MTQKSRRLKRNGLSLEFRGRLKSCASCRKEGMYFLAQNAKLEKGLIRSLLRPNTIIPLSHKSGEAGKAFLLNTFV